MSDDHSSNGDHRHVEPRRILDGEPFPEELVLYRHPAAVEAGDDPSFEGFESLVSNYGVTRAYVPESASISSEGPENLTLHRVPESRLNPFHHSFSSPDPQLLNAPSLLFVPLGLSAAPGVWDELASNDVTVNWIGLDPDRREPDGLQARALSDWIVRLVPGLPPGASAGTCTGTVHLREEMVRAFYQSAPHEDWSALNDWLEDNSIKLRPNFIHGEDWSIRGISDQPTD